MAWLAEAQAGKSLLRHHLKTRSYTCWGTGGEAASGNTRYPNALNNLQVDSRTDGSSSTTRIALFSSWFIFRVLSTNHCVSRTSRTFLARIVGPNGFCKNGVPGVNTKESWIAPTL